ncbi:MAG: trigger factor family protein, partial [Clostridia bacterium]|nr:trigger factor family protein [Clostridia bacterium]
MSLKKATKTDTPNRVELEVEVSAEQFEQAIEKAYRKDVKRMSVPGFRKGKAPRRVIERLYGKEVFYEDAMNAVYPEALDEAIEESGYEFVEDKIDLDVISVGEEGLVFKAVVTVKPEVTIKDYLGMKAEKPSVDVTDADVDAELSKLQ